MGEQIGRLSRNYSGKMKKVVAIATIFATATLLASCAEDPGDSNAGSAGGDSASSGSGSSSAMGGTTDATTAETTMSGTTMGGTMTTGGTTGGTTMSGATTSETTGEGTTMSSTTAGTTGGTTSGEGATMGGMLTSVGSIVSETDKPSLAGRQVNLEDVEVRNSVGENGFLVGSSGERQILVVPGQTADVEQGQTATIEGTLEEIPSVSEAQQQFGVGETVAALLQSQVVYLDAEQVQ